MSKKYLDRASFILGVLGTIISGASIKDYPGTVVIGGLTRNKYPTVIMNLFLVRVGLWFICLSFILQSVEKFSKTGEISEKGVYWVIGLATLSFLAINVLGGLFFL